MNISFLGLFLTLMIAFPSVGFPYAKVSTTTIEETAQTLTDPIVAPSAAMKVGVKAPTVVSPLAVNEITTVVNPPLPKQPLASPGNFITSGALINHLLSWLPF